MDFMDFIRVLGRGGVDAPVTQKNGMTGSPLWCAAMAVSDGEEGGMEVA
jgi:hypothetical protein